MERKTKLAARIVLLVSALLTLAGLTWATWTDTVTAGGNSFATGRLDLKERAPGQGIAFVDGPVTAVWHAENMYPGQDLGGNYIEFKNAGTVFGRTLDISVSNAVTEPDMDRYIEITQADYENDSFHDLTDQSDPIHIPDGGKGYVTLHDLEENAVTNLPAPDTAGSLTLSFRFRPEAGNEFQGNSVTADFTFTLQQ